jgi:hypothetical protein
MPYVHSGLRVGSPEKPYLLGRPVAGYLTPTIVHGRMPDTIGSNKTELRRDGPIMYQTPMQRNQLRPSAAGGSAGASNPSGWSTCPLLVSQNRMAESNTMDFVPSFHVIPQQIGVVCSLRQYQDICSNNRLYTGPALKAAGAQQCIASSFRCTLMALLRK